MTSTLPARPLLTLAMVVMLALSGVRAEESRPQATPCAASQGDLANLAIHPGDEVSQDVIIDSLDAVDEEDAFGEYLASRRLLQCRKCNCLPRCSRCLVMSCEDSLCTGFCKIPSETHTCEIFRCSRLQEANTI